MTNRDKEEVAKVMALKYNRLSINLACGGDGSDLGKCPEDIMRWAWESVAVSVGRKQ